MHVLLLSVTENVTDMVHVRVSPKRIYNSAMTSVFCGTRKPSAVAAWRCANWPRAMYKSLLLLHLLSSHPHFFFPKCKDKELNVLLLSPPKNKGNVAPCARPAKKNSIRIHVKWICP